MSIPLRELIERHAGGVRGEEGGERGVADEGCGWREPGSYRSVTTVDDSLVIVFLQVQSIA